MTELEKDLEAIDAEAAEFLLDSYPGKYVQHVAGRLEELGYLKVVRCRECVHRRSRLEYYGHRYYWCDKLQGIPRRKSMQFCGRGKRKVCSAGERVVAKNATGEEGASGAR